MRVLALPRSEGEISCKYDTACRAGRTHTLMEVLSEEFVHRLNFASIDERKYATTRYRELLLEGIESFCWKERQTLNSVRLLAAEGCEGIDFGGAAGGDPCGGYRHGADDYTCADECNRVHRVDME